MTFPPEPGPPIARISGRVELPAALDALGVPRARPVLVCTGGAAGMDDDDSARFAGLVRDHLVPVLERRGAVVVDGGTDSGVMRVLGRARRDLRAGFPLLGVTAAGTVRLPGHESDDADTAEPEPHHSAVLLVPGAQWGDESPWIAEVAGHVAAGSASATLVVNGGDITYLDVEHSVAAGRPVVVVAGTGRTADALARAAAGSPTGSDTRAARIARSGLVTAVRLDVPEGVARAVDAALSEVPGGTVADRP